MYKTIELFAGIGGIRKEYEFPKEMSNAQKYKQFGNAVTISAIAGMTLFTKKCIEMME